MQHVQHVQFPTYTQYRLITQHYPSSIDCCKSLHSALDLTGSLFNHQCILSSQTLIGLFLIMIRLTAPSMIEEASKTVTSGLRPKARISKKTTDSVSTVSAQPQLQQYSTRPVSCSNPLDRLCALLLGWQILDDVGKERSSNSVFDSNYVPLPTCYETYQQYLRCWEPMLIEEIKAGILSNLPLSTKRQSKCGIAMVSVQGMSLPSSILINLNCVFNENIVKTDEASTGRSVNVSVGFSVADTSALCIPRLSFLRIIDEQL